MNLVVILSNVISICQPSKFYSLQEAQALIPLLQKVTHRHESAVAELITKQQYMIKTGAPEAIINALQTEVNNNMIAWGNKVRKLGGIPLLGGAIGIDAGGFYWSWLYNETKLEFYHMYTESPSARRHLTVRVPNPPTLVIE